MFTGKHELLLKSYPDIVQEGYVLGIGSNSDVWESLEAANMTASVTFLGDHVLFGLDSLPDSIANKTTKLLLPEGDDKDFTFDPSVPTMLGGHIIKTLADDFFGSTGSCVTETNSLDCLFSGPCSEQGLDVNLFEATLPFDFGLFASEIEGPDGTAFCELKIEAAENVTQIVLGYDYLSMHFVRMTHISDSPEGFEPIELEIAPLSAFTFDDYEKDESEIDKEIAQKLQDEEYAQMNVWGKFVYYLKKIFSLDTLMVTIFNISLLVQYIVFIALGLASNIVGSPLLLFVYPWIILHLVFGDSDNYYRGAFQIKDDGFFRKQLWLLHKMTFQGQFALRLVDLVPWGTAPLDESPYKLALEFLIQWAMILPDIAIIVGGTLYYLNPSGFFELISTIKKAFYDLSDAFHKVEQPLPEGVFDMPDTS